ncbi:MAG: tannase/feruloyl esterase family alpha/beta hydrolase [Alysiella sp.]|uniref:tannase/feruloyl esterase family alpha/beta hydrolase n=1 Tax=Alysiella sp. TaxID=1872483 RepID=UPI0026DD3E9F|nr:tannase/feruloyl esterase family alpha/beta hydrolase [Alysiella sp.]MDO4434404.1 tannase/feruloyl esterase family alpha/beta hydrolase [Alysiella sp.]
MKKTLLALSVWGLALNACATSTDNTPSTHTSKTSSAQQRCTALSQTQLDDTRITQVQWTDGVIGSDKMAALTGGSAAQQKAQPHCIVEGEIGARIGADGKHYGTQFQLRLPENWNGKFLFQGGGGVNGFVAPAVGNIPIRSSTATPALMRGYAVVSMDGGHPKPHPDFGADQQARLDFAYQSIGKVTHIAKKLIAQNYDKQPEHNYFMGCSNGGREAMMAMQRYPLEFDGIIAANPGFRLSRAAVAQVWDTHHLMKIAPKSVLTNALTQQDLDKVSEAVAQQCDAQDGLKDGIINQWESCRFNPASVLPKAKANVLKAIFDGAKTRDGQAIYSGWYYDTGINTTDWRRWKLGSSQDPAKPDARNVTLGFGSLVWYFMSPANPNFDVSRFDFDRDTPKVFQTGAINDAISTDLTTFKARGGKFIMVTGVSDPVFSAKDQVDWFKQLRADNPNSESFVQMFMVPGMTHCGNGKAMDDFDPLTALENWHTTNRTPEQLLAKGKTFPGRSMPLCAYPKSAFYMGGDEHQANSFVCK